MIEFNDTSTRDLLIASFRYALGRNTGMVQTVVKEITNNWHKLDIWDKKQFVTEIREYQKQHGHLGDNINTAAWLQIEALYKQECKNLNDSVVAVLSKHGYIIDEIAEQMAKCDKGDDTIYKYNIEEE